MLAGDNTRVFTAIKDKIIARMHGLSPSQKAVWIIAKKNNRNAARSPITGTVCVAIAAITTVITVKPYPYKGD